MFFLIFFIIYFLGNIYIIYRVSSDFKLHGLSLVVFLSLYVIVAFLSVYALSIARHSQPSAYTKILTQTGYIWLGTFSIAITFFLLSNILFIFNHTPLFRFNTTLITVIIILISSMYSVFNTRGLPKITEITIPVANLPVEKLTIVQLSDIHIDTATTYDEIKKIVEITNSFNPDIIAFTGDLADIDITQTYKNYGLADFKAKYGVFAINGNHEYYMGIKKFESVCKNANYILLNNTNALVDDKFYVAGITDIKTSKYFNYEPADINKALKNINWEKPVIFLSHQPQIFFEVQKHPVTIQLSGHTHAGQIPPFDIIELFIYKYFCGLYKDNDSYIYVTTGTRWWGPPMRLFSKSEIVHITLIKAVEG